MPNDFTPKEAPSLSTYFSQPNILLASIDIFLEFFSITFSLYSFGCLSNNSWHGIETTLEFMLASFNLFDASIAISTSEPDAIKVISGLELVFLSS